MLSHHLPGWTPVNKSLFPSTLIVGSCVKSPWGQAPVCSVTYPDTKIILKVLLNENQDGGVGRHTAPPGTTRTDRKSKARGSDTKEIQNKHSSRLVGGAETGTRVERTHTAVAGLRLVECGTNGAGSPSTSRPCNPTFAQINREGWIQSGGE